MPIRTVPLVTDQVYHVLNRSIDNRPIFTNRSDASRALLTLRFYRYENVPLRLSYFLTLRKEIREELLKRLEEENKLLVEIICFCLMPNHFHFLLRQSSDEGISKFISQFQNSFTRYFNTKNSRTGHLFQGQFKAIRVENDKQLLHLSRYIHLNPYSSHVIKEIRNLESYVWSSLPEYLSKGKEGFCKKKLIAAQFWTPSKYRKFVFDRAGYQRTLEGTKHLSLEER